MEIRELDLRAAPYDLRELDHDHEPVRIDTPEGKAEYVEAQRSFTVRANALRQPSNALRQRLLEVLEPLPVS